MIIEDFIFQYLLQFEDLLDIDQLYKTIHKEVKRKIKLYHRAQNKLARKLFRKK